jgi:YHS domain-containing protein
MLRKIAIMLFVGLFGLSLASVSAFAKAKPEFYTDPFSNLAVQGYDTVAYFTVGKPVKGSESFTTTYKGAQFNFASAENLAKFKANPTAYAPQYGGYCAWAIAQGKTVKGDARIWKIVNGRLYLNYDANVQKKWEKDIPGFIAKADANWPAILSK